MINIKCMIIIIMSPFLTNAQNWVQLGNGTNDAVRVIYADTMDGLLYIGGNFKYIGNPFVSGDTFAVNGIAKWTGVKYLQLGTGQDYCNNLNCGNPVLLIFRFQDEIYCNASGVSFSGIEAKGIVRWNGFDWHTVGEGLASGFGYSGNALSYVVYEGDLVVGGAFIIAGIDTAYAVARWDGMDWHSMNFPASSPSAFVSAMAIYNGELYVAGNFQLVINGNITSDIAKFDGKHWQAVGGGLKGNFSHAEDIIVFKNELYICGYFKKSDGNAGNMIMKLQNDQWVDVAGGVVDQVHDMVIYKDELYVVGIFDFVGFNVPASNIAKWTGEKWCGLGSIFNNRILAAEVLNDDLYIGGGFNLVDGKPIHYIAKWIGGDFTGTCGDPVNNSIQLNKGNLLTLFPNPTHATLTISALLHTDDFENLTLTARNLLGQPFWREARSPVSGEIRETVDVSNWPPGVYFITLETGGQVATQKVVVK